MLTANDKQVLAAACESQQKALELLRAEIIRGTKRELEEKLSQLIADATGLTRQEVRARAMSS